MACQIIAALLAEVNPQGPPGDKYNCLVPNYKDLYEVFADECDKYGILYKMEDIIKVYKKENINDEQISLF